ncbi:cysteine desulfurase, putative [Babesia bigemina]|uniref:cysteine desulfurase n=1 Tax=Babesia bigemina TaxID=5866 RepID=A0A061D975_BABBI|nr:cysteine desulfurase, putative [Babesia bigemina]CDR95459.1 cysteine desulfurase, putative [Babesia bigemina]|eukprot:XP_012767645.1 cysteine desulfurase, putative [Babesia bigemina]
MLNAQIQLYTVQALHRANGKLATFGTAAIRNYAHGRLGCRRIDEVHPVIGGGVGSVLRNAAAIGSLQRLEVCSARRQWRAYNEGRVYLDYQATTPVDPRVLDRMLPYLSHSFGNPHSRTHSFGWDAEHAVEEARSEVAALLNCDPRSIIFTSGATESNNLAIKGVTEYYSNLEHPDPSKIKDHIITSQIDHKCVLQTCRHLENRGYKVTYLKPDTKGVVSATDVAAAITPKTFLCSIIHLNNEIGTLQNLEGIGQTCRERGVIFHTDAAQSFGKVPLDLSKLPVDLMSISGHKIYGPKGVGALYVGRRPRIRLRPIIDGGGQERGLRSGTLPTPLVVGLGAAASVARQEMQRDLSNARRLWQKLVDGMRDIGHVHINGPVKDGERYWGNLNVSFEFIEGESLLMSLQNIALSSGSACTSTSLEPSYVLRSIGVGEEVAHTSIRFGIGRFTTEREIDQLLAELRSAVERLRSCSPLYEMFLEKESTENMIWT